MDQSQKGKWKTLYDNQLAQTISETGDTSWNNMPLLPIAMKIAAKTLGGDYYYESEERIQRRKRILKLKRILDSDVFKDVVSQEEYDDIIIEKKDCYEPGLVSVQPLSLPSCMITYLDFKYESPISDGILSKYKREKVQKERLEKIKRILKYDTS